MSSVYIGNLPTNITREELTDIATRFGEIGSVTLKNGFAFIEYLNDDEAVSAIDQLRTVTIRGCTLVAEFSISKPRAAGSTAPPSSRTEPNPSKGRCFSCGREGHWKLECPYPPSENRDCYRPDYYEGHERERERERGGSSSGGGGGGGSSRGSHSSGYRSRSRSPPPSYYRSSSGNPGGDGSRRPYYPYDDARYGPSAPPPPPQHHHHHHHGGPPPPSYAQASPYPPAPPVPSMSSSSSAPPPSSRDWLYNGSGTYYTDRTRHTEEYIRRDRERDYDRRGDYYYREPERRPSEEYGYRRAEPDHPPYESSREHPDRHRYNSSGRHHPYAPAPRYT